MFVVYVLYSPTSGKTYTGFTNDLARRLAEHNFTEKQGFTLRYRPWILIHSEMFNSKREAMDREKVLKSGRGREQIKSIINNYLNDESVRYPP
jgi:putative endonuclease